MANPYTYGGGQPFWSSDPWAQSGGRAPWVPPGLSWDPIGGVTGGPGEGGSPVPSMGGLLGNMWGGEPRWAPQPYGQQQPPSGFAGLRGPQRAAPQGLAGLPTPSQQGAGSQMARGYGDYMGSRSPSASTSSQRGGGGQMAQGYGDYMNRQPGTSSPSARGGGEQMARGFGQMIRR